MQESTGKPNIYLSWAKKRKECARKMNHIINHFIMNGPLYLLKLLWLILLHVIRWIKIYEIIFLRFLTSHRTPNWLIDVYLILYAVYFLCILIYVLRSAVAYTWFYICTRVENTNHMINIFYHEQWAEVIYLWWFFFGFENIFSQKGTIFF